MQVMVLASRKGGAGKTTLAAALGVEAERQRAGPVALIDTDLMGGLASWWNERKADTPQFAKIEKAGLRVTLEQLEGQGIQTVIIDTPPLAAEAIGAIIAAADLVLVPVVPSPNDLRAIGETITLVERQRRPLVFVVNNAGRGRLTAQAAIALSQHGTVSPVVVHTRQDFRSAMIDGRAPCETDPASKSSSEIAALWEYLSSRLKKELHHGPAARA